MKASAISQTSFSADRAVGWDRMGS